jgi:glycosyltransferase involved in cell wall biosynthesis
MDNELKTSVLISTYKNDNIKFLERAIDSIINQTKKPDEIVIVVDGPIPKENFLLLNEYSEKNKKIKIIECKKNIGLGLALRKGVEECTNELILRMDSDDISRNDRIEKLYKKIVKEEYDIVGSNITEFIDDENNIVSIRTVPEKDTEIKKYLKKRCPMNHVSVIFKKESVLKVGNYESLLYNEDYLLWIKMAQAEMKFYNIQENLVNVRVGQDMYKRRGGKIYFRSEKKIQDYMLKNKIISIPIYVTNLIKRYILQVLMTNNMRQFVFQKFARKSVKG